MEENQIILERVQRREDGNYTEAAQEHILHNTTQDVGRNQLVVAAVDIYEKLVQIQVREEIDVKALQILTPKEVMFEGGRDILLARDDEQQSYYVYDKGRIAGIYYTPAKAIEQADACSGVVVDDGGRTIWIRGNRVLRNQIMAITAQEATEDRSSLAVCLDTILSFEGIVRNSQDLLSRGKSARMILEENLEGQAQILDLGGCSLDTTLYFLNRDIPVLALLQDGEAVLLTGFNEYNVVIMEPSTGRLYKKGMNDTREWMEENGNPFITYIRVEE